MLLLLLIGDSDKYMSVTACETLVEQAKNTDQQAEIIIYPGAGHSFDQPNLKPWTNPAVRSNAVNRVPVFLLDKSGLTIKSINKLSALIVPNFYNRVECYKISNNGQIAVSPAK